MKEYTAHELMCFSDEELVNILLQVYHQAMLKSNVDDSVLINFENVKSRVINRMGR